MNGFLTKADAERWFSWTWLGVVGVGIGFVGCMSVNTLLLTSEKFPPKASWQEVEILDREPPCAYIKIARLSVDGSEMGSYETMQRSILKKAASLGSDAVVFAKPEKHVEHRVMYQDPMMMGGPWGIGSYYYPGWGYGVPYGMWGPGYGSMMALPYDSTVTSLTALALRYRTGDATKC